MSTSVRTSILVMMLIAPAFAHATDTTPAVEAAAQNKEKAKTALSTPTTANLSTSSDMILVPMHDIRDAMLYLGGRVSSDEMAAVIYQELGNDFINVQKTSTLQK